MRAAKVVATTGRSQPAQTPEVVKVVVSKKASVLTVYDEKGQVIFHAPVTSGSEHDSLPLGNWVVTAVLRNPTFHYNPDLFWDAEPAECQGEDPGRPEQSGRCRLDRPRQAALRDPRRA